MKRIATPANRPKNIGDLVFAGAYDDALATPAGIEYLTEMPTKHGVSIKGGTGGGDIDGDSSELQAIVDAWPSLSDDVKASVLALVRKQGE